MTDIGIDHMLLVGALLLFASILASKTSGRLGVPTLLLFLGIGMLAGSDGLDIIAFDNAQLAQGLAVIALVFILFSGGMDTQWPSVKPVLAKGLSLATVGVLITALVVGLGVPYFTDLTLMEGLLLGAVISSTDAAAVFTILRSQNIKLKANLRPLLELESGSNDPMAFFLTTGLIQVMMHEGTSLWSLVPMFFIQMGIGATVGWLMGRLMVRTINRIKLGFDGLYPVLVLSMVLFTFGATQLVQGNGFLAVYVAGVVLGNNDFLHKKSLIRFYDGQAWLVQIVMFLTLGLLVFPSQVAQVVGPGLSSASCSCVVARPLAVFITLGALPHALAAEGLPELGGPSGGRAHRLRHLPVDRRRAQRGLHLQRGLLHRAHLGACCKVPPWHWWPNGSACNAQSGTRHSPPGTGAEPRSEGCAGGLDRAALKPGGEQADRGPSLSKRHAHRPGGP